MNEIVWEPCSRAHIASSHHSKEMTRGEPGYHNGGENEFRLTWLSEEALVNNVLLSISLTEQRTLRSENLIE